MSAAHDPPPGRPKADQSPRGAATRAAAERGGERFTHDYLGYLLGQANHALFKDFDAQVREAGLGSLEWRVLAVLSGRFLRSVLFEINPTDGAALLGACGLLVAIATLAAWLPARRAARIDPVEALRAE